MTTLDLQTGAAGDLGEPVLFVEIGDFPDCLQQLRLTDARPGADSEWSGIESLNAGDCRGPIRPALDVAQHSQDALGRGLDVDTDGEERHVVVRIVPHLGM